MAVRPQPVANTTMNTIIKYTVTLVLVIVIVGVGGGEDLLTSFYVSIPILVPVTYLSHIIFYGYNIQKDYTQLFQVPQGTCSRCRPAAFATAVWLSGVFAAWLINNGLGAFDVVSISLVTLAGYILDKRKNHAAYKALACKIAALVGKSHD